MNAFITGSRAYGTPRPNSDIDLVVLVPPALKTLLEKLSDKGPQPGVRFGRLNLICHTTEEEFQCWKRATDSMASRKLDGFPVTREEAIQIIDTELKKAGQKLSQGMS